MKGLWQKEGFTLNELLIAAMIISMLGTFAVVTYVRVYEKSRGYHAFAVLRLIRAAERLYYLDWNEYIPLPLDCDSDLVREGYLQCPNLGTPQDRAFDYDVTTVTGSQYVASAQRIAGRYSGREITLNVTCCPEVPTWGGDWPADLRPN